ncbi:MAG: methyltransferase domain-containing protein [Saprospiraceae bacterium]|nr:methyltransferase domain-containing protein [Saprospiraceae bacterium]
MIFKYIEKGISMKDDDFDGIYPEEVRPMAFTHFTPIEIAIRAAKFLVQKSGTKVLDIGSGAGKFCMIGSVCTNGHFTGVEQRDNLHLLAEQILKKYQLKNINFINSNINQIEFSNYEAFYFFNPFYENIIQFEKIDDAIDVKNDLYDEYSNYVKNQLDLMPLGTRLVTFFSAYDEVPISYQLISKDDRQKISMWEKKE